MQPIKVIRHANAARSDMSSADISTSDNSGDPISRALPPDGTDISSLRDNGFNRVHEGAPMTSAENRDVTPAAAQIPPKAPVRVWDIALTIILIVLGIALVVILGVLGVMLAFVSDGCSDQCNIDQLTAGIYVAVILPSVLLVASIIWAIARIARRRVGFWVVMLGGVAAILGWILGAALSFTAVPGFVVL
jgi:hypothetical protein